MKQRFITLSSMFLVAASKTNAFVPVAGPSSATPITTATRLSMSLSDSLDSRPVTVTDRRAFGQKTAATVFATTALPFITSVAPANAAFGGDYTPKFDDLKQIYGLGSSLDRLADKVSNPDTFEGALSGLRMFNKEPKFYDTYARNYISKSVKNNADGDPRVGYIKQASKVISSIEDLINGSTDDKTTSAEAVKRVRKAQSLIAKFLAESGVVDDRVAAYISAHSN